MAHSFTLDAIVLRTYDVAEADRFCILFTRERGKIAARARSVRRLKSRMGGTLLSFRHVHVECKEFGNGFLISSAASANDVPIERNLHGFACAEEGIELLLNLVEDHAPMPELFDVTLEFLHLAADPPPALLAWYMARVLHILGLLPEASNTDAFPGLSDDEGALIRSCRAGEPLANLTLVRSRSLEQRCRVLLSTHASKVFRAASFAATMNNEPLTMTVNG